MLTSKRRSRSWSNDMKDNQKDKLEKNEENLQYKTIRARKKPKKLKVKQDNRAKNIKNYLRKFLKAMTEKKVSPNTSELGDQLHQLRDPHQN